MRESDNEGDGGKGNHDGDERSSLCLSEQAGKEKEHHDDDTRYLPVF
jgi:hypothetical protein